jgi:putative ATP-binding cassette transporter
VLFFVVLGFLVLFLPRVQTIDPKILVSYTIVLFQLMAPLEVLLTSFPTLSRAVVAIDSVKSLGFSLAEGGDAPPPPALTPGTANAKRLELRGVTHTYRRENADESFQLGPIDVEFQPGEIVFVVGGNGSGKTTLGKLLVGLYTPDSGEILFGGAPITDDNRAHYRQHFSVVFSDCHVFEHLLGLDASEEAATSHYLKRLHLDHNVRVVDNRLSTVNLSQGQRKRLALLTAYLEDRPIYLFDEWAADQDPEFKKIFYLELLPELKARGKTIFAITHDDRYFHVADRLVKLDYGRIEREDVPAVAEEAVR